MLADHIINPQLWIAVKSRRASTVTPACSLSATPNHLWDVAGGARTHRSHGASHITPRKAPAPSPGSNHLSCLDESHLKWVLAITEKTDFSLSVHIFPLPKSNTSAEEHRFSRGRKFLHLLFSFTPSMLHPELKLSSSKKQLQWTCKTFPIGEPSIWSCLLSKWTKDAGSAWQGSLAWDCLSQWGTVVMKLALRAVPVCRLFVQQCCLFQRYRVVWNRTRLKGTAN